MSSGISLPYLLSLLGLPLTAFICLWSAGNKPGKFTGLAAIAVTFAGLVLSVVHGDMQAGQEVVFRWVTLDSISIPLTFRADPLTTLMLPLVHFIALLVQVYSLAYMKGDKGLHRYYAFLQLFVFSMLGIILAGDLIVMYIFWELVGLSSYLLIGFWYHKPRAVWAAKKAFILNRIGDAAFLSGILVLIFKLGITSLSGLPEAIHRLTEGELTLIGLLLFGGCIGKSAQFPLSGWLPDAMEGPTPVSALIHAATMVAAGIFLLARIAFLLTPAAQMVLAIVGVITMLDGSVRACRAWDIKRVLAYSTISQLGLMVFAVGAGSWQIALFHLLTHAFFKAGLFLSAGSVIHAMTPSGQTGFDPQDMRNMGGLRKKLPVTHLCYVICSAALAGLPFFSGFLSKDAIFILAIEKAAHSGPVYLPLAALAIAAAGLTAYYMTRQVRLVFYGSERFAASPAGVKPHESPALMWGPMAVLSALSAFFWFSLHPFDGAAGWLLTEWFPVDLPHQVMVPVISVAVTLAGIAVALRRPLPGKVQEPIPRPELRARPAWLRDFEEQLNHSTFFLAPFQRIAEGCLKLETRIIDYSVGLLAKGTVVLSHILGWMDRSVLDGAVRLTVFGVRSSGLAVRKAQNGKIQFYFVVTVISLLLIAAWLLWLV